MAKKYAKRETKHDAKLKGVFLDKPGAVKYVLAKMVSLHKEAVTEGLAVFQHNAEPMISISSKGSKFSGFTPRQHDYVVDVITDAVHAPIAWAALREVDPKVFAEYAAEREAAETEIEAKGMDAAPAFYEDEDEVIVEDEPEPEPVTTSNANWGLF